MRLDRKATGMISLLVVVGVRADGQKVLLAVKAMGGENTEAWGVLLDDLIGVACGGPNSSSSTARSAILGQGDEVLALRGLVWHIAGGRLTRLHSEWTAIAATDGKERTYIGVPPPRTVSLFLAMVLSRFAK
jgi:hypothetical protein